MATTVRKKHSNLTAAEWQAFVNSVNALHGVQAAAPAYRDFVKVHSTAMSMQGMSWAVHTMGPTMPGRNFLAWHRWFLRQFEKRLQKLDPNVFVPYWDWIADPQIPAALSSPGLLAGWSVTRDWVPSQMPSAAVLAGATTQKTFIFFQRMLESGAHAAVHIAVGGDMDSASSPADPVFWLHHANIDRIWAAWQKKTSKKKPPNLNEILQPAPMFGVKVSSVLSITKLGYRYA
jgi:tyrosinase